MLAVNDVSLLNHLTCMFIVQTLTRCFSDFLH